MLEGFVRDDGSFAHCFCNITALVFTDVSASIQVLRITPHSSVFGLATSDAKPWPNPGDTPSPPVET